MRTDYADLCAFYGWKRIETHRLADRRATKVVLIPWCTWKHAAVCDIDDTAIEDAMFDVIALTASRGRHCSCMQVQL